MACVRHAIPGTRKAEQSAHQLLLVRYRNTTTTTGNPAMLAIRFTMIIQRITTTHTAIPLPITAAMTAVTAAALTVAVVVMTAVQIAAVPVGVTDNGARLFRINHQ